MELKIDADFIPLQWLSFSAISTSSAQYYNVSASAISWLATAFLFAFVVMCPFTLWTLHHHGPKTSIITASVLLLLGNWIRYGGTRANNFGVVVFGQILTGLAQPFVLASPTRYSDMWLTGAGRVTATAVMSLANPLGGALGQLINPFWVADSSDIPSMVLYVSILVSSLLSLVNAFGFRPSIPCPSANEQTLSVGSAVYIKLYTNSRKVQRRYNPQLLHPQPPANTMLAIIRGGQTTHRKIFEIPPYFSRILHDHDPLHRLCWPL